MCDTLSCILESRPLPPTPNKYLYLWSDYRTKDVQWWVMIIKCTKNSQNKPTPTGPLKNKVFWNNTPHHTHTSKYQTRNQIWALFLGFFPIRFGGFFFFPQILKLTNLEQIIRFWTLKNNIKWPDTSINILLNSLHKYSQSIA